MKDTIIIEKDTLELLWLISAVIGWTLVGFIITFEPHQFIAFFSMYVLMMGAFFISKRDK